MALVIVETYFILKEKVRINNLVLSEYF
jgi:hypothetical protein